MSALGLEDNIPNYALDVGSAMDSYPNDRPAKVSLYFSSEGAASSRQNWRDFDALFGRELRTAMAIEFKGDRDYAQAQYISPDFVEVAKALTVPAFIQIAEGFRQNCVRIGALFNLPLDLFFYAYHRSYWWSVAASSLGHSVDPKAVDPEAFKAIALEATRVQTQFWQSNGLEDSEKFQVMALEFGIGNIKHLNRLQVEKTGSEYCDGLVVGGIDAILSAMVVSTYAAFEATATDLWKVALDLEPDAAVRWCSTGNNLKQITLEQLAGQKFDLSKSMGTWLAKANKASFQSLDDIIGNYTAAFGDDAKACFGVESDLLLAASVRHLFAHRGGVIDDRFYNFKVVRRHASYAGQKVGSQLIMTGQDVSEHVDSCVVAIANLLKFLDGRHANCEANP